MKKLTEILLYGVLGLVIMTGVVFMRDTFTYKEDKVVTDQTYELVQWKLGEGYGARYMGHEVDEVTRDMVSYPMFDVKFTSGNIIEITQAEK